jgi:hypothetical protein
VVVVCWLLLLHGSGVVVGWRVLVREWLLYVLVDERWEDMIRRRLSFS